MSLFNWSNLPNYNAHLVDLRIHRETPLLQVWLFMNKVVQPFPIILFYKLESMEGSGEIICKSEMPFRNVDFSIKIEIRWKAHC